MSGLREPGERFAGFRAAAAALRFSAAGLLLLAVATAGCTKNPVVPAPAAADPVTTDPRDVDPDHPPALRELSFDSHGASLNAILYLADGPGPHPTVLLLHGFPGNEKNLDLAQALRRSGLNVFFFHYRGSWGSEGDFTFGRAVEDVGSALEFLRGDAASTEYRVDGERLIPIGHSMGGFAALVAASRDARIACAAALTPWNIAVAAEAIRAEPDLRARFAAFLESAGPIRGMDGAAAIEEILKRRDEFDLRRLGAGLRGKSILLVGAAQDRVLRPEAYFDPLVAAYEAEPGIDLTPVRLDGDHAFSWTRIALTRAVTRWLDRDCAGL